MGIRPFIVELILPTDLRGCRPDFQRPFVATELSPEDPPTSRREELVEHFPWLRPGECGIREIHLGDYAYSGKETRVSILILGNDTLPERIPTDGERVILRRPIGEIFHSDVCVSYFVAGTGIEPVEGDVALQVIQSVDNLEIGANLREFLWFPVTERLEECIRVTKGEAWFRTHADEVYSAELSELSNVDLATITTGELDYAAARIIEDIECAKVRTKGANHV